MPFSLGIHIGHNASCAVVRDGRLIAAVQQERFSRRKHDGRDYLSNTLPIKECLQAANITIDEVSSIISCFQASSPGGVGLQHPVIEPGFSLFDPMDERHIVISHHLAHAYCTFGCSGFAYAAVLICDQAGSSTQSGEDFHKPFPQWYQDVAHPADVRGVRSECLSIYDASAQGMELKYREFGIPHNQTETFVQNAASLYDNVSRFVFRRENAYGQLMALAAYKGRFLSTVNLSPSDIIQVLSASSHEVVFRNDWQCRIIPEAQSEFYANLAHTCQEAFEKAVLAYVRHAAQLTTTGNLAVAGGVFLNILANTAIAESGLFSHYYVPSAPHDAGISVGCAYFGDRNIQDVKKWVNTRSRVSSDRLGISYSPAVIERELQRKRFLVSARPTSPSHVAQMLATGQIIARFAGRAEFGPRALGGRSLLGSPMSMQIKDRLNAIKGRQTWRPVAPMLPEECIANFMRGPTPSPFMTFAHTLDSAFVDVLKALSHPDASTRAQTISWNDDPWLSELLLAFGKQTGYPILVNTSLNTAGQPIVETPGQALELFLRCSDIEALLIDSWLVQRLKPWESRELLQQTIRLPDSTIMSFVFPHGRRRVFLTRGHLSEEVSEEMFRITMNLETEKRVDDILQSVGGEAGRTAGELYDLITKGFLQIGEDSFELV